MVGLQVVAFHQIRTTSSQLDSSSLETWNSRQESANDLSALNHSRNQKESKKYLPKKNEFQGPKNSVKNP